MNRIDPIILGHNQFIGVNHLSQDSARERTQRFGELEKIAEIVEFSAEMGAGGMMFSTHPRTKEIVKYLNSNGFKDMNYYPIIPYAQGYVRKLNEKGPVGLLNEVLMPAGISGATKIIYQGGLGLLTHNIYKLLGSLIDIELAPFRGLKVKAVFLHNILTDLALAAGAREVFAFFVRHITENHKAIPAFATMNFARLVRAFHEWGIKNPLIMTSFNQVGFQMNPSREECERCLREYDVEVLAMSVLAAGYLKPKPAFEYLFSLPKISSVVVGVSTKEHARETFEIIRDHMQDRR